LAGPRGEFKKSKGRRTQKKNKKKTNRRLGGGEKKQKEPTNLRGKVHDRGEEIGWIILRLGGGGPVEALSYEERGEKDQSQEGKTPSSPRKGEQIHSTKGFIGGRRSARIMYINLARRKGDLTETHSHDHGLKEMVGKNGIPPRRDTLFSARGGELSRRHAQREPPWGQE